MTVRNLKCLFFPKAYALLCAVIAGFLFLIAAPKHCFADSSSTNQTTGYHALILDEADLLTDSEEKQLLMKMQPITEYGNAAFVSVSENSYSTSAFADRFLQDTFHYGNSTVFVIDMDNRNIWLQSSGEIEDVITVSYANTITDNIYTYASRADYYSCAAKAFEQEYALLDGHKIAQPMKYINNALLAFILALLINYFIVRGVSKARQPDKHELLDNVFTQCRIEHTQARFLNQTKTYSPPSSSGGSSGGHSHSSGGGGHSSGGHSSGGGHRF